MRPRPATLVLGASGRIGQCLRRGWGPDAALWQSRKGRAGGSAANDRCFDPLLEPEALVAAARETGQILCLAGPVPGRGNGDMADHWRLAEAALQAAALASRGTGGPRPRVILASSAAVYGARAGSLHEDLPLSPVAAYGQAKAEMEQQAARRAEALGIEVCMLRIGNVAGLDAALGGWRPGFVLDRFADGRTPRRSYIGVAVLADVIRALLSRPQLPGVLNVAQPQPVEMGALLAAAARPYATRDAPPEALAEVALDVTRLAGFVAPQLHLPPADPAAMVAQWSMLEPHIKERPRK